MQNIVDEINKSYNFSVTNIKPFRDYYILETSSGKKTLKKNNISKGRIYFINCAKEYLYRKGFVDLDRYNHTLDSEPLIEIGNTNYTISDFVEGSECNFDSPSDVILATRSLAKMHKASKGYIPSENCIIRNDLGMLPVFFKKRLDEIKKIKKSVAKGKNHFDFKVLECIDYFYTLGEEAKNEILTSKYFNLVDAATEEPTLCHHDFTHSNIIIHNNIASIINFECCTCELKIYDIANLLKRKLRKCDWDIAQAKIILDEYRKIEDISIDELSVLKTMLKFPQKFWRIINKYYNSKRSWSEKYYVIKLQEVIDEKISIKHFLENFENLI